MRVAPISAEKANENAGAFEPWRAGDYDFIVQDAAEEVSSTGNDMIKLTLHVYNREGQKRTVFDYLVNTNGGQWKIRHFAEAVGMVHQYEAGNLDIHDIVTRPGRCKLRIKPASGNYPANNAVQDYLPPINAASSTSATHAAPARRVVPPDDLDDAIPF